MTIAPERPPTESGPAPPYRTNWLLLTLLLGIIVALVIAVVWLALDDDEGDATSGERISGSGKVVLENRPIADFDSLALFSSGRIILTQGTAPSLSVETDDNLLPYIRTTVEGGALEITTERDGRSHNLDPTGEIVFRLGVTDLTDISLFGAGRIEAGTLTAERLDIQVLGSGDIAIEALTADVLDVSVPGHADLEFAGAATSQSISWMGAGTYDGSALQTESAEVDILGAATITVWATETLDITITGSGTVEYYGQPQLDQRITGAGDIRSLGLNP
jgi:hypothetical protein